MMRALFALLVTASSVAAQDTEAGRDAGLMAWDRIYSVASHPRCTNCHVGAQEEPMWNGLSYGPEAKAHGMNIKADDSRIGAESIPCRTCHVTSERPNTVAYAAPQLLEAWRLPPVEMAWLGKDSATLCRMLRAADQTDGANIQELVAHVQSSPFVAWGFNPGGGRSAPPGTPSDFARDIAHWGQALTPCR